MGADALRLWKVRLHTRGASLTPWQADTLWGHLCWALRRLEGEPALEAWLDRYRTGNPTLLVSDGFPGDLLPAPLFPPPPGGEDLARKRRRPEYLSRVAFQQARATGAVPSGELGNRWQETVVTKNTLSRHTWSSLPEQGDGGLYMLREQRPPAGYVTVYVRVADAGLDQARAMFEDLVEAGYGKRRGIGYGSVEAVDWEPETELAQAPAGANGWVTLSSFIPRPGDPTAGAWDLRLKHARFGDPPPGDERAKPQLPWKVPLLFVRTGSTFYGSGEPCAGGVEADLASPGVTEASHLRALQYALAFPVNVCLPPVGTEAEARKAGTR